MKRIVKIVGGFVVVVLVTVGILLGLNSGRKSDEKISIVATNFPAYDFARAVAGDKAEIKMLIQPGTEAHSFEPTPQDMIDIKNSELFIYTGGESDAWIEEMMSDIDANKTQTLKMMDVSNVVEDGMMGGMEFEPEDEVSIGYDEHVWTSLRNSISIVESVRDKLVKISPENESEFERNAGMYINKLMELDKKFQEVVEEASRHVIVFGDRFPLRYFAYDYGLEAYAAFPGCSEQTEASSKTIAFLVDKVKEEKIPVVFKIEMSSGKIAETIANETGAKVLKFHSMQNITSEEFDFGFTYVRLMENNLRVLEVALK